MKTYQYEVNEYWTLELCTHAAKTFQTRRQFYSVCVLDI